MPGDGGATFNMQGMKATSVYIAGENMYLTQNSSSEDLKKALLCLKEELGKLDGVPEPDREEIAQELDAAAREATAPDAPKDQVTGRLQRIKQKLEGLGGVAAGALDLAKSVAGIAALVGAVL